MFFHLPQSEFKLKRFRRKDLPRYEIRERMMKKKPVIAGRRGCFMVEGLYFTIDTLRDRNLFPFLPPPPPPSRICASKQMSPNETTYWATTTRRCPRLPSICQSFSGFEKNFFHSLIWPEQIGWEISQINLKSEWFVDEKRFAHGHSRRGSNFICLIYFSTYSSGFARILMDYTF